MRRANRKFSYWLVQLPLWRYLLTYFAIWLVVSYASSSAATWTGNHWMGMDGQAINDTSPISHLILAVFLTCISGLTRPRWRRRLALRAE